MRGLALLPVHSLRNGADPARTPQQAYQQTDMFLLRPAVVIDVNIGPIFGSVTIYFDRRAQRKERLTATFSVLGGIFSPAAARGRNGSRIKCVSNKNPEDKRVFSGVIFGFRREVDENCAPLVY